MKILHVDPETAFGGGERQVLGLLRHLAARGHENVLAAAPGSRLAELLPAGDARLAPLAIRNDLDLLAALRLRGLVARERPAVVHFHTGRAHALSPWARRRDVAALVTRRMDYAVRKGLRTELLFHRAVDAVVAISEGVRRALLAGGVRPERVRVIRSAVEPPAGLPGPAGRSAARARFGVAEEAAVVGVIAVLERRKGHDVLLHALADLRARRPELVCLVCGAGSERAALEALSKSLGLTGVVRFLGERRQVADVLAALDVLVLPSRHEGLGVAALEGMSMALPLVASAVGGIPEAVEDGRTGLLVPPEEPSALGRALEALLADPERARAMGARGRERVLSEFPIGVMAERYERLYRELAAVA